LIIPLTDGGERSSRLAMSLVAAGWVPEESR
jgi:hypothetical protein